MHKLRILYASGESPGGSALPASRVWRRNLHDALVDLGHDVEEFHYDRMRDTFLNLDGADPEQLEFMLMNRPRLGKQLLTAAEEAVKRTGLDVLFTYFYSACVSPDVIRRISRMGVITINWFCNASYQFRLIEELAPAYDYCLVPEISRLADYRRIGARPIYCQEAANPALYRPIPAREVYDVTFVGQCYGERPRLMRALQQAGVRAHAFGPGWKVAAQGVARVRGGLRAIGSWTAQRLGLKDGLNPFRLHAVVSDEEMVRLYSRSRVSIGFGGCADTDSLGQRVYQVRLRDFEAPMSGACYLAEYSEEYAAFFEPDVEVATYRNAEELVEKSKRLLKDTAWRQSLRHRGRDRAVREHTWQKRLAGVFRQIGLS